MKKKKKRNKSQFLKLKLLLKDLQRKSIKEREAELKIQQERSFRNRQLRQSSVRKAGMERLRKMTRTLMLLWSQLASKVKKETSNYQDAKMMSQKKMKRW